MVNVHDVLKMAQQKYSMPNPEDILAISTLVVGVGPGGNTSMLAWVSPFGSPSCNHFTSCYHNRRVAVADYRGQTLLFTYVQPTMTPVTDYRTSTTGIQPEHLTAGGSRTRSIFAQDSGPVRQHPFLRNGTGPGGLPRARQSSSRPLFMA